MPACHQTCRQGRWRESPDRQGTLCLLPLPRSTSHLSVRSAACHSLLIMQFIGHSCIYMQISKCRGRCCCFTRTADPNVPCRVVLIDDGEMACFAYIEVVGSIGFTIPILNTELALTRTEVQKGIGLPSMSAVNAGPARAIRLST